MGLVELLLDTVSHHILIITLTVDYYSFNVQHASV